MEVYFTMDVYCTMEVYCAYNNYQTPERFAKTDQQPMLGWLISATYRPLLILFIITIFLFVKVIFLQYQSDYIVFAPVLY